MPAAPTSPLPAGRPRLSAVHGAGVASERLDRLSSSLGLPVWTGVAADDMAVAVLFQDQAPLREDGFWARPFAAWIDIAGIDDRQVATALARAGSADAHISISTSAANDLNVARQMTTVLGRFGPLSEARASDVEFALHEAISNAVLHGNLRMDGMKGLSLAELERFSLDLSERLRDPALAARRVEVTVTVENGTAYVEVGDEGDGFTREAAAGLPCDGAAEAALARKASGRGLDLIGTIADSLDLLDGGRRIRMGFAL